MVCIVRNLCSKKMGASEDFIVTFDEIGTLFSHPYTPFFSHPYTLFFSHPNTPFF